MNPRHAITSAETQGQRLRDHRLAMRIEQSAVADAIGVSVRAIDMIERGTYKVSTLELTRFANFIGLPLHAIFSR
mgnify:CR=1 FL=1